MITEKIRPKPYYRPVWQDEAMFFICLLVFVICVQGCGPTIIALPTNAFMLKGAGEPDNPETSDLQAIVANVADPAEYFDFRPDNLRSQTSRYLKCVSDITWEARKQLRNNALPIAEHNDINFAAHLHLTIAKNKRDFDTRIPFACLLLCDRLANPLPICNE